MLFRSTTGMPWLPIAADVDAINVASARGDSASTLVLYRRLLALRRREPALTRGSFRMLPRQGEVLAYVREAAPSPAPPERFLVLVNFSKTAQTYAINAENVAALTDRGRWRVSIAVGTHARRAVPSIDEIALSPDEAVVIRLAAGDRTASRRAPAARR